MSDPLLGEKGAACPYCGSDTTAHRPECRAFAGSTASIPVPTSSTPTEQKYAPHPLGAVLGPAAIKPRRKEPLLVAEIIRLLERHGVPWEQAVREAAGLMAQTVEEAEGWWAFEMAAVESPSDAEMIAAKRAETPSIPSTPNPELEAALDRYRDALMLPGTDVRTKSGRRLREGERESSRAALVSLYSRLQQENAALRQQFYELQQSASDEVLELKAELSKVKETALTQGEIETLYFLAFRSASVSSVTIVKLDKLRRSAVPTREAGE